MTIRTTAFDISTAPTLVFGPATTWANTAGASNYEPQSASFFNDSAIRVRFIGTNSTAAIATGFPLLSSATLNADMMKGDELWVATTASTATLLGIAGRQVGGKA